MVLDDPNNTNDFQDPLEDIDPILEQAFSTASAQHTQETDSDPAPTSQPESDAEAELPASNVPDPFDSIGDDSASPAAEPSADDDDDAVYDEPAAPIVNDFSDILSDPILDDIEDDDDFEDTPPAITAEGVESSGSHTEVSQIDFSELDDQKDADTKLTDNVFNDIPVNVSVELGRSQLSLRDVYELGEGSIIELNRGNGDLIDLVINGQVIAQGEVVSVDNKYGLRIRKLSSKLAS